MPLFADALTTPHLTQRMAPENKKKFIAHYKKCKRYGIRTAFGVATGGSYCQIGYELIKGEVKSYGKRKIGGLIVASAASALSGGTVLLTNATKIAKAANATHKVCAAAYRTAHNVAELPMIIVDYALVGEYVPSCEDDDYNVFGYPGNGLDDILND